MPVLNGAGESCHNELIHFHPRLKSMRTSVPNTDIIYVTWTQMGSQERSTYLMDEAKPKVDGIRKWKLQAPLRPC